MKVFCFIFSVYILFLSLAPCGEMKAFAELQSEEIYAQAQVQNDTQPDESGDQCSPFCICSCCHFSTAYQFKTLSVTDKIAVSVIVKNETIYQSPSTREYKTSVWQPPRFNSITLV